MTLPPEANPYSEPDEDALPPDLVEHLQKIGPASVRGLARSLGRDVKRVHEDVTGLVEWGIIERTDDGKVSVPYDVIHADFDLRAVA